jgi:hypothetical protein
MPTFLVFRRQTGPEWDPSQPLDGQSGWADHASYMDRLVETGFILLGGPVDDGPRVLLVVEADSEEAVRATLAHDPWTGSHLLDESIDRWTIRLDGRAIP